MAPKSAQSSIDGLKSVYQDIAGLMLLPDAQAHAQFLTSLMQGIQQYVVQQGMQAMQTPMPGQGPGGPGGPGGPPSGPPGMMPGGSGGPTGPPRQGPPPGAGGPMPGPSTAPNPDELRRLLSA